jgi:hypothetical protein
LTDIIQHFASSLIGLVALIMVAEGTSEVLECGWLEPPVKTAPVGEKTRGPVRNGVMKVRCLNRPFVSGIIVIIALTAFFVFEINRAPRGPHNGEEKDDLGITNAFYDRAGNELILQTPDHWARLSIKKVVAGNKKLKYLDPVPGNTLNWSSFREGALSQKMILSLEPIPVQTKYTARLSDPDPLRPIWDDVIEKVQIPAGTMPKGNGYALYRLANGTGLKGYLLVTPTVNADGRGGVQFYYDPGTKLQVTLRHPFALFIFGFSYIGLLLITVSWFRQQPAGASAMLKISLSLHAISCAIIYVGAGVGQAWSGQSNAMDGVMIYTLGGVVLNFALYVWGKSLEPVRRGDGTALSRR